MFTLKVVLRIKLPTRILLVSISKRSEGLISHSEPIHTCFCTFGRRYKAKWTEKEQCNHNSSVLSAAAGALLATPLNCSFILNHGRLR